MLKRVVQIICGVALGLPLFSVSLAIAQTSGNRFEGTLSIVWGDPKPGVAGGATRFSLTSPDGTRHQLQIGVDQQNAAIRYFGKRVIVQGQPVSSARGGEQSIAVDRLELAPLPQAVQPQVAATKRVLYVLLRFRGDAQEPHPPTFFSDLTNPNTPPAGSDTPATINGFYGKTSWGQLRWRADVAGKGGLNPTRWLTLPKRKDQYAPCGWNDVCADLTSIANDGLALVEATGVNLSRYDNINFVLNNDLDCCAWGGGFTYKGKFYGTTWAPPWGQEASIYVHELGHSLGLPHSGWVYYAYDSPWDEMSSGSAAQSMQCGSYFSANSAANDAILCTEPGGGFITAHKHYLGWIPAANMVVVDAVSDQTIRVYANALGLGTGTKMIKVCLAGQSCTGSAAHYLTIEARIGGAQYENGIPGNGVIIHDFRANRRPLGQGDDCFFNTQSGWAVPIDSTRGDYDGQPACNPGGRVWPNYALGNAQYLPGQGYTNRKLGIVIKVIRQAGWSYLVRVRRTK